MSRISKIWIYTPLYLALLVMCIYLFYNFLESEEQVKEETMTENTEEKLSSYVFTMITCFEKAQDKLEGVLKISPSSFFTDYFNSKTEQELDAICNDLKDLERGQRSYEDLFELNLSKKKHLRNFLDYGIEKHHKTLHGLNVYGIFYDRGRRSLSKLQQKGVNGFLHSFRKNSNEYGILIIGRSSSDGQSISSAEKLSRDRAEGIKSYVSNLIPTGIKLDYVYFGTNRPRLNYEQALNYGIDKEDYENTLVNGEDRNDEKKLNQSALLVLYPLDSNLFKLDNNEN